MLPFRGGKEKVNGSVTWISLPFSFSPAVFFYIERLYSTVLVSELALYLSGALLFLRNGGHTRFFGLSDHHFLHYTVTAAACLHVYYILHIAER
jgi:predicted membrane channel-forming protein YqfA (hemolysin III family)